MPWVLLPQSVSLWQSSPVTACVAVASWSSEWFMFPYYSWLHYMLWCYALESIEWKVKEFVDLVIFQSLLLVPNSYDYIPSSRHITLQCNSHRSSASNLRVVLIYSEWLVNNGLVNCSFPTYIIINWINWGDFITPQNWCTSDLRPIACFSSWLSYWLTDWSLPAVCSNVLT